MPYFTFNNAHVFAYFLSHFRVGVIQFLKIPWRRLKRLLALYYLHNEKKSYNFCKSFQLVLISNGNQYLLSPLHRTTQFIIKLGGVSSTNDDRTCHIIINFIVYLKSIIIFLNSTHTHKFDMHRQHLFLSQAHYAENNIAKNKWET